MRTYGFILYTITPTESSIQLNNQLNLLPHMHTHSSVISSVDRVGSQVNFANNLHKINCSTRRIFKIMKNMIEGETNEYTNDEGWIWFIFDYYFCVSLRFFVRSLNSISISIKFIKKNYMWKAHGAKLSAFTLRLISIFYGT